LTKVVPIDSNAGEGQTRRLLPQQGHPFAISIWDIRLQAMWITFTGIYVITGTIAANPANERWLSSTFLTIAGILVLLLVCHTVIAVDRNASRKTLLVALTAWRQGATAVVELGQDRRSRKDALRLSPHHLTADRA
jgi:hypothetical protein